MAFLADIWPNILQASQSTGLDPRLIAAQAALESNWGKSAPGNNLFGIKGGSGPALATTEVVNGQPVQTTAQFRGYSSPGDSVMGYADFINKNPRYGAVKSANGLDAQIAAMGKSGYATDPNYAEKISSIAHNLQPPSSPPMPDGPKGQEAYPPQTAAPFGSMAPAPQQMASAGIPSDVASYAASDGQQESPLKRLGKALQRYPDAPQAPLHALGATNGNALLQYMQSPNAISQMLMKQRLQGTGR